jgi:uncharacterized protein YaaR (DUF327 family)
MKYLKIFEQNSEKWALNKLEELYDDMDKMGTLVLDYLVTKKTQKDITYDTDIRRF